MAEETKTGLDGTGATAPVKPEPTGLFNFALDQIEKIGGASIDMVNPLVDGIDKSLENNPAALGPMGIPLAAIGKLNPIDNTIKLYNETISPVLHTVVDAVDNGAKSAFNAAVTAAGPDTFLNLIAEKAGVELSDKIKNDEAFKQSLFDAVTKDPSVLAGIMAPKEGAEPFDMKELAKNLEDPNTRRTMTEVLKKVAEDPNDEFGFDYLNDIAKASKEKDYKKLKKLLDQGGIVDDRVDYAADPAKAFNDFINDPVGFAKKFPAMMGMEGEQAAAMQELLVGAASLIEMFIGGETGYRAFFQHYGPIAGQWGMDMFDRLSGEADRRIELSKTTDLIDRNNMAPLKFENLQAMVFQMNANKNDSFGSTVSSTDSESKGKLNETSFSAAAHGLVNPSQDPAWVQAFYDNQANNNAELKRAGGMGFVPS